MFNNMNSKSNIPDFIYSPPQEPLSILYDDDTIIVVNKPSGLLSVPGKTEGRTDCLSTRLQALYWNALLVHRLDCDTSGVMIFAKNKIAQGFLGQEFEKRRAQKTYIARLHGKVTKDTGLVDLPLATDWPNRPRQMIDHERGRQAQTKWQVLARQDRETRVSLSPLTGRSHQLRVHMLALGHPIIGDPIYSDVKTAKYPRLMLHAQSLGLHHPKTREWVYFESPSPF